MNADPLCRIIIVAAVAMIVGLFVFQWWPRDPVIGKPYVLRNEHWDSSIVFSKDGTFFQKAVNRSGAISEVKGTWQRRKQSVNFSRFLFLVDPQDNRWLKESQEVNAYGVLAGDAIVFREEPGFFYALPP